MTATNRVLITGANGFVGHWLANYLSTRVTDAKIFGASLAAPQMEGVRGYACDITDAAAVDRLIADVMPDSVIHLAAMSSVTQAAEAPDLTWAVNLTGTRNLANSVLNHTPNAKFVFAGSSDCYGATFARWPLPLNEDAPLSPMNPYAASKASADLALGELSASRGLLVVRFRPFNHFGVGQDDRFVIPSFASQIARIEAGQQEPIIHVGDLRARREFLDVRDIVSAYVEALAPPTPLEPGIVINLASNAPIPIGNILDRLIALSDHNIEIAIDPDRVRGENTPFAGGDSARAKKLLNWKQKYSLDETLQSVLEEHRARIRATI